jgi:hypothetical protein
MASRYTAILDYLGRPWVGVDLYDKIPDVEYSQILICTPTDSHYGDIRLLCSRFKVPILCEKPITRVPHELADLLSLDIDLSMINQYNSMMRPYPFMEEPGRSHYNYFRSGKDGIEWDCINIIGLSDTPPTLTNKSPLWDCKINGQQLNLGDMDSAYVKQIRDKSETCGKEYIEMAHKKVWEKFYVR